MDQQLVVQQQLVIVLSIFQVYQLSVMYVGIIKLCKLMKPDVSLQSGPPIVDRQALLVVQLMICVPNARTDMYGTE